MFFLLIYCLQTEAAQGICHQAGLFLPIWSCSSLAETPKASPLEAVPSPLGCRTGTSPASLATGAGDVAKGNKKRQGSAAATPWKTAVLAARGTCSLLGHCDSLSKYNMSILSFPKLSLTHCTEPLGLKRYTQLLLSQVIGKRVLSNSRGQVCTKPAVSKCFSPPIIKAKQTCPRDGTLCTQ